MIEQRIKEIRDKMKDRNLRVVSQLSGVPYPTLWRFYKGRDVAFYALVKIDNYFSTTN